MTLPAAVLQLSTLVMGASAAPVVDVAGRPVFQAAEKVYYADASNSVVVRRDDRWVPAGVRAKAPSAPQRLMAPVGYPVFVGNGENFGFYPYEAVAVGSWPDAVAIADVDGDGRNDVVLATTFYFDEPNDYHVFVFRQDANGALLPPVSYPYNGGASRVGLLAAPVGAGVAADVIVGTGLGIDRFASTPVGLASPVSYAGGVSETVVGLDVNRDGHRDVVGLSWSDGATIFTNDGAGAFPVATPLASTNDGYSSMRARDLDGDGYDDLVIGTGQGAQLISVHWNINGELSPPQSFGPNDSMWYANAGDINHDGLGDVIASRLSNSPTWLWHFDGQGNHIFASSQTFESYEVPETLLGADLNRDGRDDIMVLHGGWLEAGVYLQGETGMGDETLYDIPYASHYQATGLAVGDINGDGCTDAVVADYNSGLIVLYGHSCSDRIFADGLESAG